MTNAIGKRRAPRLASCRTRPLLISENGLSAQYRTVNTDQRRALARIRHLPWLPPEDLAQWQLAALNTVLRQARQNVPFYSKRIPPHELTSLDELSGIPAFTRREALEAGSDLVSRAFEPRRLLALHTAGTTGAPMIVYVSREALQQYHAFFARLREWLQVPNNARVAAFVGTAVVSFPAGERTFYRRDVDADALLCSADQIDAESLPAYVEELDRFKPEVIDGYPSSIEAVARYVRNMEGARPLNIRPRAIVTSSETLVPSAHRLIESVFQCPVFDHYSSVEMAAMIAQCRAGSYHIMADFGYVELLTNGRPALPGEVGEIVATGFVNDAMPFIRYATGDFAVAGPQQCACGRTFPTVQRIIGRREDVLVTPEGLRLSRVERLIKSASSLIEARLVQDELDHVTLEAVARWSVDPLEEATLMRELRNRLGPTLRADLVRVQRIPRTPSGKFRTVVNLAVAAPVTNGWSAEGSPE